MYICCILIFIMKIVFTGGITGGHFYPIIAIAEAIHDLVREEYIVAPKLYYIAPTPFDSKALFENNITFLKNTAGKIRRYPSIRNFTDLFFTAIGFVWSFFQLLVLYPDVVISKGGYASVPTVLAARVLAIPIIIHESDAKPGRANLLASHFATRIAVSFQSAITYFPKKVQSRVAVTGTPVRKALRMPPPKDSATLLGIDSSIPTVFIMGGSTGSKRINEIVLAALPDLVKIANVIHQTGAKNIEGVKAVSNIALEESPHVARYKPFSYLSAQALLQTASVSCLIVSRAGAGTIAEIATWKLPAILIPIPEEISHDQRKNAYAFAQTGAAEVIEEANLTPHILVSEIQQIISNPDKAQKMGDAGASFSQPQAGEMIAKEALAIAITHES